MKKTKRIVISPEKARAAFEAKLAEASKSELCHHLRLVGYKITENISKAELRRACLNDTQEQLEERSNKSINDYRQKLMQLFANRPDISAGPSCPKNCWQHPDLVVILCYQQLKAVIDENNLD